MAEKFIRSINIGGIPRREIVGQLVAAIKEYQSLGTAGLINFFTHSGEGGPYGDLQLLSSGVVLLHKNDINEKEFRETVENSLRYPLNGKVVWTLDETLAMAKEALGIVLGISQAAPREGNTNNVAEVTEVTEDAKDPV